MSLCFPGNIFLPADNVVNTKPRK